MAVSDLKGTTWKLKNSGLIVTDETQGAAINVLEGTITDINNNNNTFNQLTLYPTAFGETNYVQFRNYDSTTYSSIRPIFRYTDSFGQWKVMLDGSDDWVNTSDVIVTFTGGNTTEPELIAFMEANATQQTTPAGKTQIGTRVITKKMFGTREITKEVVNGVVVYEKQASVTITFTIDGTAYQADDGMTWSQWVASAYNTNGYVESANYIFSSGLVASVTYNGNAVWAYDLIVANRQYTLSSGPI